MTNKIKQIKWYDKLMILAVLLAVTVNPISLPLVQIASDMLIAILIQYSWVAMIVALTLFVVGHLGLRMSTRQSNNKKLKELKNKKTSKAGKYIDYA